MLEAVHDYVIVELAYEEKKGSIIVPEYYKKLIAEFRGVVVSIGPDYPYDVKVGDTLIFDRHEGFELEDMNNKKYLVLRDKRIAGREAR